MELDVPVVRCKCECGREFDDLIGNTIAEALKGPVCPECGKLASIVPCGNAIMPKGYQYPDPSKPMTPDEALEYQMAMDHRKWCEDNDEGRESGRLSMKEVGPDYLRPHGNAPRAKKFF